MIALQRTAAAGSGRKAGHKSRLAAQRMVAALDQEPATHGQPHVLRPGKSPVLAAYQQAYGRLDHKEGSVPAEGTTSRNR